MIEQKTLAVSVVIPCYNEEENISLCLDALKNQTIKPFEVIVVDNNCTDATGRIAKRLGAKVITEKTQGLIAARNAGMDAASGEVIARIDADSRPAADWLQKITAVMLKNDELQAVTGSGYFYDFPFAGFCKAFRNLFAVYFGRLLLGHDMLWGSNMAIRANAWHLLKAEFCAVKDIMEDLDISMHVADEFGPASVKFYDQIRADISVRRGTSGLVKNFFYIKMWPKTLKGHRASYLFTWPAVMILLATATPFMNTIARFYDGRSNRWTLNYQQFKRKADFDRENP